MDGRDYDLRGWSYVSYLASLRSNRQGRQGIHRIKLPMHCHENDTHFSAFSDFMEGPDDQAENTTLPSSTSTPAGNNEAATVQKFDNLIDAITFGASLEVILPLIEMYAAGRPSRSSFSFIRTFEFEDAQYMKQPLVTAIKHSSSLEVVNVIIHIFPKAVRCSLQVATCPTSNDQHRRIACTYNG